MAKKTAAADPIAPPPVPIHVPTTYTVLFAAAIQGLVARGCSVEDEDGIRWVVTKASQIADAAVAIDLAYIPR